MLDLSVVCINTVMVMMLMIAVAVFLVIASYGDGDYLWKNVKNLAV